MLKKIGLISVAVLSISAAMQAKAEVAPEQTTVISCEGSYCKTSNTAFLFKKNNGGPDLKPGIVLKSSSYIYSGLSAPCDSGQPIFAFIEGIPTFIYADADNNKHILGVPGSGPEWRPVDLSKWYLGSDQETYCCKSLNPQDCAVEPIQ